MTAKPTRTATPVLAVATALTALALVLTGCTASGTEKPKPTPSATETEQAEAPGITEVTDPPGTGENLVGALSDTAVTSCELADGTWNVVGTVTNPTDAPADYRIYVSLLNPESDTRALKQVDVPGVEAGATADWQTSVELADEGLTCVLRVERYTA
ncbi:hypothetical protein CLV46_3123 [Diaminobutyricimonas aerilata]|uniref:Secreted protein n=1 Tax=Diaminobutyricimonas aerilata TaxID=1162967 RepID=A0A2M9CNP7_9MICO|nr:hypothetical protein [Diaminobutyricimonas aerilata]PJJ73530.1 hypothetical protein CLV46_3123 [Diaminobutyricimonas aerilata]